jgi:hypothetical protein
MLKTRLIHLREHKGLDTIGSHFYVELFCGEHSHMRLNSLVKKFLRVSCQNPDRQNPDNL